MDLQFLAVMTITIVVNATITITIIVTTSLSSLSIIATKSPHSGRGVALPAYLVAVQDSR